jgi:signal transduction histidine kinase
VDGRTTLQFLDISADIFYNELKAQDQYINMSNATLSHEVRNPLNSIITISMIQEQRLIELQKIVTSAIIVD